MRIVLDTNVLFDRATVLALADDPRPKVLPAIAFAERARQRQRDFAERPERLRRWLESMGIEIEPLASTRRPGSRRARATIASGAATRVTR